MLQSRSQSHSAGHLSAPTQSTNPHTHTTRSIFWRQLLCLLSDSGRYLVEEFGMKMVGKLLTFITEWIWIHAGKATLYSAFPIFDLAPRTPWGGADRPRKGICSGFSLIRTWSPARNERGRGFLSAHFFLRGLTRAEYEFSLVCFQSFLCELEDIFRLVPKKVKNSVQVKSHQNQRGSRWVDSG